MQALQARARTADTYLAGLGASGALMAGAAVAFIAMVGVVTFNAWPEASGLFTFSGGQAELGAVREAPATRSEAKPLPTITVIPTARAASHSAVAAAAQTERGGLSGIGGHHGGSGAPQTGSGVGNGGGQAVTPPPQAESTDALGSAISNTGTVVQKSTQSLGSTLNDVTGTDLGTPVTALGETVNDTLQSVSGT
jgi:hypothetical protein